jgi:hypothetical protein
MVVLLMMLTSGSDDMHGLCRTLEEIRPCLPGVEQRNILRLLDLHALACRMKSELEVRRSVSRYQGCSALTQQERSTGLVRALSRHAPAHSRRMLGSMEDAMARSRRMRSSIERMQHMRGNDPLEMMQAMSEFMPAGSGPDMSKMASMMKLAKAFSAMEQAGTVKN